jgi:hypothetical protein
VNQIDMMLPNDVAKGSYITPDGERIFAVSGHRNMHAASGFKLLD